MTKNTTRINEKHAAELAKIRLRTPGILAYRIVLIALGVLLLFIEIGRLPNPEGYLWMILGLLCIFTGAWGMGALFRKRIVKSLNPANVSAYTFDDESMSILLSGEGISGNDSVSYSNFDWVIVGNEGLYLRFKQDTRFLVVDIKGFTEGTADETARLIESKGIKTTWLL